METIPRETEALSSPDDKLRADLLGAIRAHTDDIDLIKLVNEGLIPKLLGYAAELKKSSSNETADDIRVRLIASLLNYEPILGMTTLGALEHLVVAS